MDRENQEAQLLGTTFAQSYEILSILGRGASSVVYRARFVPMDQMVAVKVMLRGPADEKAMRTLKRELRHAGRLKHPNIAATLRVQLSDAGIPFIVAELVEGTALSALLHQRGRLTQSECAVLFDQIMDGLEYAHARGIIHCDLKPSNIMVQLNNGQIAGAKIVDFGISKSLGTDTISGGTTSSGDSIFGTPAYMSPEQCQGKRPDVRSDIYSLACVMYECLTGVQAFQGESAFELINAHLHLHPRLPSVTVPDLKVSADLQNGIMSALQKEPPERPASVQELRAALKGRGPSVARKRQFFRIFGYTRKVGHLVFLGFVAALAWITYLHWQSQAVQDSPFPAGRGDATGSITTQQLPSTARGLLLRGEDFERLENHDAAVKILALADAAAGKESTGSRENALFQIKVKEKLAHQLTILNRLKEAQKSLSEAARLSVNVEPSKQAALLISLSQNLSQQGDHPTAIAQAQKAVSISEARMPALAGVARLEGHKQCGAAWRNLADRLTDAKKIGEAEKAWNQVFAHDDQQVGVTTRLVDRRQFAQYCNAMGRYADAVRQMREYVKLAAEFQDNHDDLSEIAFGHEVFGDILTSVDTAEADREYARSVDCSEALGGPAVHYNLATRLYKRAINLYALGKTKDADAVWLQSEAEFARIGKGYEAMLPLNAQGRAANRAVARARSSGLPPAKP